MRYYLLLFSFYILGIDAMAQADTNTTKLSPAQDKRVRLGVKLGLNGANFNFNRGFPTMSLPVETTWKLGVAGGFMLQIPIVHKLFFKQEYLYSQMRGRASTIDKIYMFDYLSFPIMIKYDLLSNLSIVGGAQFDLLVKAKQQANGITSDITHDVEERSIGATAGVEYYVWQNVGFAARYMYGLNNIGIGQRSNVTEFKYESVQITTNIRF